MSMSTKYTKRQIIDGLQIVKTKPNIKTPDRGSNLHVYYKIYSPETFTIPEHSSKTIKTGLFINVCGGQMISVYADKDMADLGILMSTHNRCCDCNHEIELMYFNLTPKSKTIQQDSVIARFNVINCVIPKVVELDSVDEFLH